MNIDDWLQLNPNHTVLISTEGGVRKRATLAGGHGVDREIRGYGATADEATQNALDTRSRIKATLP